MGKEHSSQNTAESFKHLSTVHQRYRQTDDRWICDSKVPNVT